jgi:methoxymalonate biosynthesis acyl carrier protein
MNISDKVRDFLKSNQEALSDDLTLEDDDNFFELGFVDSTFAINLVCFVETEFNISVSDEDLDLLNFSTINRITQFVEGKKNEQ